MQRSRNIGPKGLCVNFGNSSRRLDMDKNLWVDIKLLREQVAYPASKLIKKSKEETIVYWFLAQSDMCSKDWFCNGSELAINRICMGQHMSPCSTCSRQT